MKTMLRIGDKHIAVNHPSDVSLRIEGGRLSAVSETHRSLEAQLNEEMQKEGIQWGDAIAWATSLVGISSCPPCKARQRILNQARRLGLRETMRQIKETFRGSR